MSKQLNEIKTSIDAMEGQATELTKAFRELEQAWRQVPWHYRLTLLIIVSIGETILKIQKWDVQRMLAKIRRNAKLSGQFLNVGDLGMFNHHWHKAQRTIDGVINRYPYGHPARH